MIRRYLAALVAAALLACAGPASATLTLTGVGAPGAAVDALQVLVNGMAHNSWTRLSDPGEASTMANVLADTKVNLDGGVALGNATWVADANVAVVGMPGCGTTVTSERWAFSGGAVSDIDGEAFFFGGGHTDSCDGSFYLFSAEAGAASRNASGNGATWTIKRPSGMYLDANKFGEPVGSTQTTITTPTGNNQSYWITTNKNGQAMPANGHSYHGLKYVPGTKLVLLSNYFGYNDPGGGGGIIGAPYTYNTATDTLTQQTPTNNDPGDGVVTNEGYAQPDQSSEGPGGVCPAPDGSAIYVASGGTFGWEVGAWTGYTTSTPAVDLVPNHTGSTVFENSIDFGPRADCVVIVDPGNASDFIFFMHGAGNTFADTQFMVGQGLKGVATVQFVQETYASGTCTTNGQGTHAYAVRSGVIWIFDGSHLCEVTPNATLTAWTIASVGGMTGDTPSIPAGGNFPQMAYLPTYDAFVTVNQAIVEVYRP